MRQGSGQGDGGIEDFHFRDEFDIFIAGEETVMCMHKLILSVGTAVSAVFAAQAAEVEITVASGEKTLAQALADEAKTLGLTDDLVKLGAGKLNIGALPEYAGNIHIKQGVVYASATNAFGRATGYTKVYDGAQLQTYTNVTQTLNFGDEQFIIEGTGPDGNGAIRCLSTTVQKSTMNPLGKNLTLTGNALITDTQRHDLFGTTDLGGHTLTLKGSFSFEGSVTTNGNVIANGGSAVFPTQCSFPGDASNVFTLTNNVQFMFCYSVLSKAFWTLDVADGFFLLSVDAQDNLWNGPVILRKMTSFQGGNNAATAATVRFPKKVTGDGGFNMVGNYQELRLGCPDNDFKGGIAMNTGSLRIDADGAVPRDGGRLSLTNSAVIFNGVASCSLPPVEFSGTGYVGKCSGTWKTEVVKSGAGELVYDSLLGSELLDVRGGTVRFARSSLAGLNGGSQSYGNGDTYTPLVRAAYTNTPYLMLTNAVTKNLPRMETIGWYNNELVTYAGYIWNTNATDVTWTWHVCIDDACDVFLDGKRVISQSGWTVMVATNLTLTPGPHAFAVRAYNGTGGAGASDGNGKWKDSSGANCNTKGLAVDIQARGMVTNSDYYAVLKDPGDGTLFTTSLQLARFATMKFAPGTGIGFDGMPYTLEHLIGLPNISNGDLTVTGDWTVDGADLVAGRTAASSGKIIFADGVTLKIDDTRWGGKGSSGMMFLTAEGGIEGMPVLEDVASRYHRRLVQSADGKSLTFYATCGCAILVR